MAQTAVEWFNDEILIHLNFDQRLYLRDILEKAKEMEEEQHQETWFESTKQFDNSAEMTYKKEFKQYYKETFKSE
jgi:hypothetical protein